MRRVVILNMILSFFLIKVSIAQTYSNLKLFNTYTLKNLDSIEYLSLNEKKIDYKKLSLITGSIILTATAIQIYQYNSWWKDWRQPFHFQEDLVYGKSVDKIGHAWGAAFTSFIISRSYEWCGINRKNSIWIGAIGGSIFQLLVEFQDGFSQWGFDRVDAACDILGGFYPVAQYYFPIFQNLEIKASYSPRKLGKPGGIPGQKHTIIDDYEGQTFWLSLNTSKFYPEKLKFLTFLNLAIGYSVRNTDNISKQYGVWLLSLDLDFKKIIPQTSYFLINLSEGLNYFKFPMPTVQFSPKTIWFGLYF